MQVQASGDADDGSAREGDIQILEGTAAAIGARSDVGGWEGERLARRRNSRWREIGIGIGRRCRIVNDRDIDAAGRNVGLREKRLRPAGIGGSTALDHPSAVHDRRVGVGRVVLKIAAVQAHCWGAAEGDDPAPACIERHDARAAAGAGNNDGAYRACVCSDTAEKKASNILRLLLRDRHLEATVACAGGSVIVGGDGNRGRRITGLYGGCIGRILGSRTVP